MYIVNGRVFSYRNVKNKYCIPFLTWRCHYLPVLILKYFLTVLNIPGKKISSKYIRYYSFCILRHKGSRCIIQILGHV